MTLIHSALVEPASGKARIVLRVDRLTLAKRRWRGVAEDKTDFGFDLEKPIGDGAAFFETSAAIYVISQFAEEVLEITLGDATKAAHLGWMIGNLHFSIAIEDGVVLAPADPAILQLLEREHIHFSKSIRVFRPLKVAAGHHHHHEH
jgi:urease accessory protein